MASPKQLLEALRAFGLENDRLDALVARRFGAAPAEFKAMDHIHASGDGLTPGQLGDLLALSSGAVTALIDRLERLGWVRRDRHPSDRRSVIVRRANETESEAERIYAPLVRAMAAAAGELTPAEREVCVRFLESAAEAVRGRATELRDSGPAPIARPGRDSPPTPAA